MQIEKKEIKKILVIRFKGLGDILLSVPAIRALKKSYPGSHLAVLVNKEAEAVLSGLEFIDELVFFDRTKHKNAFGFLGLMFQLRKKKYDLVVDLICYPKSALLAYFSGAKYRAGTPSRGRRYAYNISVVAPKNIIYAPEVHLLAVKSAGAEIADRTLEIIIPRTAEVIIKSFLERNGLKAGEAIGINPFTNFKTRAWGLSKYAELSDALVEAGNKVILLWGPGEDAAGFLRIAKKSLVLAPETDIKQLAALVAKLKLVVTTNTFTKHIAAAVQTPTLTIYGATNPKAWESENSSNSGYIWAGVDCQPCEKNDCANLKCLNNITVKEVLEKTKSLIG